MAKSHNNTASTSRSPAIRSRGGALAFATGAGLLLAVLGSALTVVYLERSWAPRHEAELARRVSQILAGQEAARLQQYLGGLHARIASAAGSPRVQQSLAEAPGTARRPLEESLLALFPDAIDLRILALGESGTASFTLDDLGLRSHIEVDLVRRAGQEGRGLQESFEAQGRWLTSLVEPVAQGDEGPPRAVVLLTLDNAELARRLALPGTPGAAVLQQLYTDSDGHERHQDIASAGETDERGAALVSYAPLADSPWQIAFTPGAALLDSLAIDRRGLYTAGALASLGGIGGVLLAGSLYRRRLRRESEQLLARAGNRRPLIFSVPELAPIARQLRGETGSPADADRDAPPPQSSAGTTAAASGSDGDPASTEVDSRADPESILELDLDLTGEQEQAAGRPGFPEHIFRAYDIRGDAERELTDSLVQGIGAAIGDMVSKRGQERVIVGSDGRLSSPRIRSQLITALLDAGLDVIDIGTVPTPLLHFAIHHLDCPSGVMVTGSHNPREDNGLKIVLDGQTIATSTIQEIREHVLEAPATEPRFSRGSVVSEDVLPAYIEELAGDIAVAAPLKVVIDAANGVTGPVAPQLFSELGCEVVPLHCEVDGHFPHHSPDTSDEANLAALCAAVTAEQADFGVAFDGDGDRLAVVTGSGHIVRTDRLMMLLAEDVVSRNPGVDVVFDVKCSRNLAQLITRLGGRPVMWKTGHALMKQKVVETGALLAGEFSGHIFFGERWYGHDDGMYAAARLAEILSTHGQSLEEALAAFPQTVNTPEIRIPVPEQDKFALMEKIVREAHFSSGKVNTLDGIRVDFESGWGLLRASNTSACLTARFEADSEEHMAVITQAFREQVTRIAPGLALPF